MKIETKFDIGQEVWINIPYLNNWGEVHRVINRAEKFSITGINVRVSNYCDCRIDTFINYFIENLGEQDERCLYDTKEEAEAKLKEMRDE